MHRTDVKRFEENEAMALLALIVLHGQEGHLLEFSYLADANPTPANQRGLGATIPLWLSSKVNATKSHIVEREFGVNPQHGNVVAAEHPKLGMPSPFHDEEAGLLPAVERIGATSHVQLFGWIRLDAVGCTEHELIRKYNAHAKVLVVSFKVLSYGDDVWITRAETYHLRGRHSCG